MSEHAGAIPVTVLGYGIEVEPIEVRSAVRQTSRTPAVVTPGPAEPYLRAYRLLAEQAGHDAGAMVFFGPTPGRLTLGNPLTLEIEPFRPAMPIEGSISVGLRRTASRL